VCAAREVILATSSPLGPPTFAHCIRSCARIFWPVTNPMSRTKGPLLKTLSRCHGPIVLCLVQFTSPLAAAESGSMITDDTPGCSEPRHRSSSQSHVEEWGKRWGSPNFYVGGVPCNRLMDGRASVATVVLGPSGKISSSTVRAAIASADARAGQGDAQRRETQWLQRTVDELKARVAALPPNSHSPPSSTRTTPTARTSATAPSSSSSGGGGDGQWQRDQSWLSKAADGLKARVDAIQRAHWLSLSRTADDLQARVDALQSFRSLDGSVSAG